ncbi:MAG TPA: dihydroxyacetone kinase subunit DhaL [archaeon]|nr:dihydroxyacetone kinase subunit DhaL [archaeon]
MTQTLDYNQIKKFLIELSDQVSRAKTELNSMDAACGDGDFGSTMASSFEEAAKFLKGESGNDVGVLFTSMGTSILSTAGGASGPTVATFFTEAGKLARGKHELGLQDLASMLDRSDKKIRLIGGAKPGDKTLIDALEPAVSTLRAAANNNLPLQDALNRAAEAARIGCASTKELVAKHGKARYLGEQTLGFVDPGAYLVSLVFTILATTMK